MFSAHRTIESKLPVIAILLIVAVIGLKHAFASDETACIHEHGKTICLPVSVD